MKTSRLLTISLIIPAIVISWQYLQSQVTADFEAPDTVSTGQQELP